MASESKAGSAPLEGQHSDIEKLLTRPTKFGSETCTLAMGEFEPGTETIRKLAQKTKVLVIGSGGLGCEMLKDLALSGFRDIHTIDMDHIDLTNLNRQFLFRMKDVGKSKAEVAAKFLNDRVPGVSVTPHVGKIQDKDDDFYKQFDVIICGLDNLEARRWINQLLISFVDIDEDGDIEDPSQIIPLIDGGTEGFKGHCRVIIPHVTACMDCLLDLYPQQQVFQMCTIAQTPRQPAHCIDYAVRELWPKAFPGKKLDKDSPVDMRWICERAQERADAFGIKGVTYTVTMGVVKNIIPAIASTNALISAACINEVFKLVTFASHTSNYTMFAGATGAFTTTMSLDRKDDCLVCKVPRARLLQSPDSTLQDILDKLEAHEKHPVQNASITVGGVPLFMAAPESLRAATAPNLQKPISELIKTGDECVVTGTVTDRGFRVDARLLLTIDIGEAMEVEGK